MAGVKGRSGRRPLKIEVERRTIIDKAWKRCERAIDNPQNKIGDSIAKDIATKTIPQNLNLGDSEGGPLIIKWET